MKPKIPQLFLNRSLYDNFLANLNAHLLTIKTKQAAQPGKALCCGRVEMESLEQTWTIAKFWLDMGNPKTAAVCLHGLAQEAAVLAEILAKEPATVPAMVPGGYIGGVDFARERDVTVTTTVSVD
jgi:hypothetical protein